MGDIVAMPLKTAPSIAFGKVAGDYQFVSANPADARHTRPVEWLRTVPRSAIDQDLLYSFGAIMTVCKIERNNAEVRVRDLLSQRVAGIGKSGAANESSSDQESREAEDVNLEELAQDVIRKHIERTFDGQGLAELVEAVLRAQG